MMTIREEAVARELSPRDKRTDTWWPSGGVDGVWLVARRTARWRERLLGLEMKAALDCEALSLMAPIRSLSVVIFFPIERERSEKKK